MQQVRDMKSAMPQSATNNASAAQTDSLPAWDLSDLYPSADSPQVMADLARAEQSAKAFSQAHAGTLANLSGAALATAIAEYERVQEILGRVASYAQLLFAGNSSDPATGRFYQTVNERVTAISSDLIFFSLELNRVDDAVLEAKLADPALARYRPWLRDLRVFRPHQLSDDLEKLTHERDLTASAAWSRLFDETVAAMRINLNGEDLTVSATLNKLSDHDRAVRQAAGKAIGKAFGDNIRLFSLITNTLAKDKEIEDTWRHYPRPASFRNRANMVEDEVVDALATAVRDSYPRLSHRYYQMKAKWLGLPKLQHWDRSAPLPNDDDRLIEWPDARKKVLDAYGAFSPELASVGRRFFDHPWIDARPTPGKSGAPSPIRRCPACIRTCC